MARTVLLAGQEQRNAPFWLQSLALKLFIILSDQIQPIQIHHLFKVDNVPLAGLFNSPKYSC